MRAWAIVLVVAVVQCSAESEDPHRKSRKVGSFVETIGAADLAVKENGKARFTFWEKTSPDFDKPKVSCGLKTNVPGNYTLEIVRPDQSKEIFLVTVERAEGETEGFLRAYFPVNVQNMRPCEIHVRLLQGVEDDDGLPIGTVQITARAVPRTKRDEASRQLMKKMPQKEQRSKNKNKKIKNKTDNKTKVHEFTTSGAAALQEIAPIRQAAESQERRKITRPITKKNKNDKSMENDQKKSNGRQNMQKKKDAGRQQRRKDGKNKLQGLTADSLRQKNTLRSSEEALQNPIQIDLIKHRKPKSVSPAHLIENTDVEKFAQSNKNEAKNTAE